MAPIRKSVAWDYFEDKGDYIGECKLCQANISFKSGVSNMTKHVIRKHPTVNLMTRETKLPHEQSLQDSSDEDMKLQLSTPNKVSKKSVAWDNFVDKGNNIAECNICNTNISYKSGLSHLTRHLQRKHQLAMNSVTHETKPEEEQYLQDSSDEEIKLQHSPPVEYEIVFTSKRSIAWEYFVDKGNYMGECNICKKNISFKSGVSNLTKHVQRKHKLLENLEAQETEPEHEQYVQDLSYEEMAKQSPQPSTPQIVATITFDKTHKRSMAWEYFVDKGNYLGECNICKTNISFKSGVSNLTKHVKRKHKLLQNSVTQETESEHEQYLQELSNEEMAEQSAQPSTPQIAHTITIDKSHKRSMTWEYFVDKGDNIAECNICKTNISLKSGVSNLTKHVQRKHQLLKNSVTQDTESEHEQYLQDSSDEEITPQSSPQIAHTTDKTSKRSMAWEYFVDKGEGIGECTICKTDFSYKSGVSNLTKHIRRKHPFVKNSGTQETEPLQDSSDEEMLEPSTPQIADRKRKSFISEFLRFDRNKPITKKRKKNVIWDYFIDKGNNMGECIICKRNISLKWGVSALVKHCQRHHSAFNLGARETEPQHEEPLHDSSDDEIAPTSSNSGTNPNISELLRRDYSNIKKEIDDHIMNLFIWDMQPFTIVEDEGFRSLLNFMVPNYVIPKRKYFANTLLTRQYEAVKTSTKTAVNEDAETICLTTDMWTSRNNESYLAVMGHYIDKNFELQSVLLECKVLESNEERLNLSEELQNVVQDWNVSDKILLIVSDNNANIKNAITNLQWKHFVSYIQTLNIAVQKALGNPALLNVLNKVKAIISETQKKKSEKTWKKLQKYQELANKDEMTKWNSTLYMLQGFVEHKDEINAELNDSDDTSIPLTTYEWGVCESLIVVLQPCEEVLKEISDQNYVSGSSVLPITVALTNALDGIIDPLFPDEVEMCRDDLLSEITTRFSNVENSKTFTTSTFLDPRYKLYFGNPAIAEQTKRHVIGLVAGMMDEESVTSTSTPQKESETAGKQQSLLWSHYNKKMHNIRPEVTANSRAVMEVERYLDDIVLSPDTDPLDWWRSNQTSYPYLAKLARSKLNSMAISVPCEHLFVAATNITERTNRDGSSKVEQLFFLQKNKKRRHNNTKQIGT